ncbi:unnamed protein product [Heligmosomoides polygyrus]|uniref:Major facilitator superfamily (MFS) profile domain-containing protein n=1 Tax=Heligmosomoides polygyrus TaxID=6339 RepID=A0A3P7YFG4_HELPZ|nr:unnamed protein product [Heligmosomoides polygyrus]
MLFFFAARDSSNSTSNSSLTEKPKYLNGGYGWVVVGFSFILHFIADGLSFSFGVLFPKIQERFEAKRFGASSVASLFLSLPSLLGPIAGFITDVCDCKKTILIGGIVCCLGAVSSYFCQSILMFTLCFGGLIGVGLSLVYNAAIVIVTYNFEQRRGVATALAVSGTGVGTIVFPVFLKHVSPISCVLSVIIVIGVVVKDVEWQSDTPEYKVSKRTSYLSLFLRTLCCFQMKVRLAFVHFLIQLARRISFQEVRDAASALQDHPTRSRSVGTFMNRQAKVDLPPVPEFSMLGGQLKHLEHLNLHLDNSPCTTVHVKPKKRIPNKTAMSMDAINNIDHDSKTSLPMSARLLRSSLAPGMTGNRIPADGTLSPSFEGVFFCIVSLKDNPFLLSVTSLYFVLDVPYVFFYDFAVENLKVRFHLTKCLRRVFTLLVLFDGRFRLRKHLFLTTLQFLYMGGTPVWLFRVGLYLVVVEWLFQFICTCFGFFISSNYVLQSVMLTSMWEDMRNFQSSYALTSFCEGIATLFGPPVIGMLVLVIVFSSFPRYATLPRISDGNEYLSIFSDRSTLINLGVPSVVNYETTPV